MEKKKLISREEWIKRFQSVHEKGTYSYSCLPKDIRQSDIIEVYCNIHNEIFKITPTRHYSEKQGCPKCKGKKISETRKSKRIERSVFIQKAKEIHGDQYEYSELPVEFSLHDSIILFCNKHNHIFFCTGLDHLAGKGCDV